MTDPRPPRRGLGRGLSALMADAGVDASAAVGDPATTVTPDRRVSISQLRPNPDQPRRRFDDESLAELAQSIREKGILQPLIVRPAPAGGAHAEPGYEIVAGERRWRAAQRAGLHEVPVLVRNFDDTEVLEIGIIENIQREGLNPIDEAAAYRQLIERFGRTQDKIAEALGKSRSHIANCLRLLNLPPPVQAMVVEGRLSSGHARALITASDPLSLARRVLSRGLNVRQTEALARAAQKPADPAVGDRAKDADTRALQDALTAALGLKVSIDHRADGSGTVTLRYRNLDQLDGLCTLLGNTGG
jgi:ParB family transcriptional regulator, chromosome partitioning protein